MTWLTWVAIEAHDTETGIEASAALTVASVSNNDVP